MEFSTDGEAQPHSTVHVTRSDGTFSSNCIVDDCSLEENKEREDMEEQEVEEYAFEQEEKFKRNAATGESAGGGRSSTNRAADALRGGVSSSSDTTAATSQYMDSNICEGESDMEDIQVISESFYSSGNIPPCSMNSSVTSPSVIASKNSSSQNSLSASTSPQSYISGSHLRVKSPLTGAGNILKSSSADVVISSSMNSAIFSRAATGSGGGLPQGSTLAGANAARFGGGNISQPSSCGKLFHEIAAANSAYAAVERVGKDLSGRNVVAGNSPAFSSGRYELLRSVSGPTTKAATASSSEKSCYSANASSEVKSTLQRHILSKRFSANAVLAMNSKLNPHHVATSQSLQTSPSSNSSSAHHSPPHRDQRSLQHQLSSHQNSGTGAGNGTGAPMSSSYLLHPISAALSSSGSLGSSLGAASSHHSRLVAAAQQRHNQINPLAAAVTPSNNSNYFGVMADHNMEQQQPKRCLTLSNSYGITATHKDATDTEAVQLDCAKEPLRKTYSEPNLKMLRSKLKLHTHHHHNQQQQQQSLLEQGRAYSTIEEHPLGHPSSGGATVSGPPLQNLHGAGAAHANRLAAAALQSQIAVAAAAANKQHLLATLSSGGLPPGVGTAVLNNCGSSPLFGGPPAFLASSGGSGSSSTGSQATKRSSVDLLQPPSLAKSKTMSFLTANSADLALNFGCNHTHGVSSTPTGGSGGGQPSFGHFRTDTEIRSPSSDNYHSPLRIRLSDESSCGSLSPHVPVQVQSNSDASSNSSVVNISKSSSFHGTTAAATAGGANGGLNFHPSPNHPGTAAGSPSGGGAGAGLLGTNLKQPFASLPHHPCSQTSQSHHGRFLTPSPTSNSAANSAILHHPSSSSSSSPLESSMNDLPPSVGNVLGNMSLPSPHLRQQQQLQLSTAAAVLQQHHLQQVAAAAAAQMLANNSAQQKITSQGTEGAQLQNNAENAAAAAVMAAAVAARYNISSNDVTSRDGPTAATGATEFTPALHRHLSESSISSSNDGNSHPPLRRILGNAPQVPAVPPMPALLPFGAASSSSNAAAASELAAVAAASLQSHQQQTTPFRLVNSTSMSAIPTSSSLFLSAAAAAAANNPNNNVLSNPQTNMFGGAVAVNNKAEFDKLFNYYYNAYSNAAALAAAVSAGTVPVCSESNLLVPTTRYAHPPKVVIQPPPPTPQFAEMQLSSNSDSSRRHSSMRSSAHHSNSTESIKGPGVQALEAKLQQKKKNQLLSRNSSSSSNRSKVLPASTSKFENRADHVMNDCDKKTDQLFESDFEMSSDRNVASDSGGESSVTSYSSSDPRHQKMTSSAVFQDGGTIRERHSDSSSNTITPPSGSVAPHGGVACTGYISSSPDSTTNDSCFSTASPLGGAAATNDVSTNAQTVTSKQALVMQHSSPESSPSAGHALNPSTAATTAAPSATGVVLKKHQIFMMHSLQNSSNLQGGVENDDRNSSINKSESNDRSHNTVHKMTGLGYNPAMLKHSCTCVESEQHLETPLRLQYVWMRLLELDIPKHCRVFLGRETTLEELQMVHNEKYAQAFSGADESVVEELKNELLTLPCGGVGVDVDLVWNTQQSPEACLSAVGVLLQLTEKVASNHLSNAFALIRPPGHHAEAIRPLGFSYFNNIAIAAKNLLKKNLAQRILIVDWDVHHGNGTEQAFEADPNVLYISIHRYDDGSFFPGTGSPCSIGCSLGTGHTVNVGFTSSPDVPMADEDYMAAFRAVVIPFAQHFQPDVVLVSAGFDASRGHSKKLGGYIVSPECFGWMTKQLLGLANGKVVLCLEGGFELKVLTESIVACICQMLYASSNMDTSSPNSCSSVGTTGAANISLGASEVGSLGGLGGAGLAGILSPCSSPSHSIHQQSAFMRRMHPPLVKKTSLDALPSPEAIRSIEQTLQAHVQYWPQQLIKFAQKQLHISQSEADSLQSQQSQSISPLHKSSSQINQHPLSLAHQQHQVLSNHNAAFTATSSSSALAFSSSPSPSSSPSSTYSPLNLSSTPRTSLAAHNPPIFTSNQLFDAKVNKHRIEVSTESKLSSSLSTMSMPILERSNTLEMQMPVPMDEG